MGCNVKEYLDYIQKKVLERVPDSQHVGRTALLNIKRNGEKGVAKIVEDYILMTHLNNSKLTAHNKIYNKPTGNQGFDGIIKDVKITDQGLLDLKIEDKNGKKYNYSDVDIRTGRAKDGQRIQLAVGLDEKLFNQAGRFDVSGMDRIQKPVSEGVQAANKYVSHMLLDGYDKTGSFMGPYVKRWHTKAKKSSSLYKETIELIGSGFGNPVLLEKIKATMFITGDIDRKRLADATTLSDEVARRNYEILQTELPKLDREIKNSGLSVTEQENLDDIFGKGGFAALYDVPGLIKELQEGPQGNETQEQHISRLKGMVKVTAEQERVAKKLYQYNVNRDYQGEQNGDGHVNVNALAALEMLEADGGKRYKTLVKLVTRHSKLYQELRTLSKTVRDLNKVVNGGKTGTSIGKGSGVQYNDYDEHGTADVFDTVMEFRVVDRYEIEQEIYRDKWSPWIVISEPGKGEIGIVARKSISKYQDGLGINTGRLSTGVPIKKEVIDKMGFKDSEKDRKLLEMNIRTDWKNGNPHYFKVLNKAEFTKAEGKKNVAQTLYRGYVHNKELIETQTVRELMLKEMTIDGTSGNLRGLNNRLKANKKKKMGEREAIHAFIKTDVSMDELKMSYPEIVEKYERVTGVTTYGGFDQEVTYVRKDMKDMVVGHQQGYLAPDGWPKTQEWERVYRQLVQMLKLKLVVANPVKLAADAMSNVGILMTMDVPPQDVWKYGKDALRLSAEMSKLEGALVQARLKLSLSEAEGTEKEIKRNTIAVERADKRIKDHEYYDAIRYGFVQSMGTSMVIKEFDTVSGLQHTIDELVKKATVTKGKTNAVHDAIVWWMEAGFSVDDMLNYANERSLLKGTEFADELTGIADRLKAKKPVRIKEREAELDRKLTDQEKEDIKANADVIRYVGEFLASPSSEIIRQGSRAMQMADAMARWTLFQHLIKKEMEKAKREKKTLSPKEVEGIRDDAAMMALDTFVDYRLNLPGEIKLLSDVGVLMFPSFWLRTQKVIMNLVTHHPLSATSGYLFALATGTENVAIYEANVLNKAVEGHLVHAFQDVIDPGVVVVGL